MKKLLSILEALILCGTASANLAACGETPTTNKTDLSEIIKIKDLDAIDMIGSTPTNVELLVGIKTRNLAASTLTVDDFDFKGSVKSTIVTIIGKNKYKGEVNLKYQKKDDTKIGLNLQVQKDFEFSNVVTGKTELLIELKYDAGNNSANWDVKQFKDLTLSKLLKNSNLKVSTAKSKESFEFLKNNLGLTASNQDYKLATFNTIDTNEVKITIVKCDAKVLSNTDKNDFFVAGGTVTIQFTRYDTLLDKQYILDLKTEDPTTKIITNTLLDVKNMSISDFNAIPEFHRGGKAGLGPQVGSDISQYFKTTTSTTRQIRAIQTLINQSKLIMNITSAQGTRAGDIWDSGDKMKFTIGFGEVTFDTEFSISIL